MRGAHDEPQRPDARDLARWWRITGAGELRQILYWRWDPIGISDAFPATWDEYDSYMNKVFSIVKDGGHKDEIAAYLEVVERRTIGMHTDEATRHEVAERVLDWYEESLGRWEQGQTSGSAS